MNASAVVIDMHEYKEGKFHQSRFWERVLRSADEKRKEFWLMLAKQVAELGDVIKHHSHYMWKKMSVAERVRFTLAVKENIEKGMSMEDAMKRAYTTRSIAVTARVVLVILAVIGAVNIFK